MLGEGAFELRPARGGPRLCLGGHNLARTPAPSADGGEGGEAALRRSNAPSPSKLGEEFARFSHIRRVQYSSVQLVVEITRLVPAQARHESTKPSRSSAGARTSARDGSRLSLVGQHPVSSAPNDRRSPACDDGLKPAIRVNSQGMTASTKSRHWRERLNWIDLAHVRVDQARGAHDCGAHLD